MSLTNSHRDTVWIWGTSFIKTAKGADLCDLFHDRLRLLSLQSGCNHDFSALVVRLRWGAVHDDRCSLPGSLPLQEIKLLGAPLAPEVFCRLGAAVPSDASCGKGSGQVFLKRLPILSVPTAIGHFTIEMCAHVLRKPVMSHPETRSRPLWL